MSDCKPVEVTLRVDVRHLAPKEDGTLILDSRECILATEFIVMELERLEKECGRTGAMQIILTPYYLNSVRNQVQFHTEFGSKSLKFLEAGLVEGTDFIETIFAYMGWKEL